MLGVVAPRRLRQVDFREPAKVAFLSQGLFST